MAQLNDTLPRKMLHGPGQSCLFISFPKKIHICKKTTNVDISQEQRMRHLQVEKVCADQGPELYIQEIPLDMFFYMPEYNLLYCFIQKAGSTTWMQGPMWQLAEKATQSIILHYITNYHIKT